MPRNPSPLVNVYPGAIFHKLLVLDNPIKRRVQCRCKCGTVFFTDAYNLVRNHTKSCGCYIKEVLQKRNTTHGKSKTKLYRTWRAIRERCANPTNTKYHCYGGRGISMCTEWLADYSAFFQWSNENGYVDGLEIDRIDNDGNYEAGNCRWVTHKVNSRNKRTNRIIEIFGEKKSITEWSEDPRCKVTHAAFYGRLHVSGWKPHLALTLSLAEGRIRKLGVRASRLK